MPNTGLTKTWTGRIHYFTGGTVAEPKQITYTAERWHRSLFIKQRLLAAYGVNAQAKVLVCYPFSPWSIGSIFTEASLYCGAEVLPLGNHSTQAGMIESILSFQPTHICSTARNLIYLAHRLKALSPKNWRPEFTTAFVAGEVLKQPVREKASSLWQAQIVNVYGMAEFDMLGSELPDLPNTLSLVPEFDYAIRELASSEESLLESNYIPLELGIQGELMVKERGSSQWYATADHIQVVGQTPSLWMEQSNLVQIQVLGRMNESVSLADGTKIIGAQVDKVLLDHPDLNHVQVTVNKSKNGESIHIDCVPKTERQLPDRQKIRQSLLKYNIDLVDSVRSGYISKIDVRFIQEAELQRSIRGKIPRLLEVCPYESV
ncbi:MAG: AMP-binding protein [Candidatus Melainabacteria bacterium]|nr:AMP-binding protein [Candidatus Melainabacteria bacterium]